MNKLLNDYQFLELENQELRLRIAELKAKPKYPSIAFNLQLDILPDGKNSYKILDECGYFHDSFHAESDEKAIEFMNYYKKHYEPTKTEVIKHGVTDNFLHCLNRYTSLRIINLKLEPFTYYIVKANRMKVTDYSGSISEEEAIARYDADIAKYFQKPIEDNKIIII